MRWAILTGLAVFVCGCTFGVAECTSDAECAPGSCVSGFCVLPDAGGAGGGGGGGGGMSGGGAGGGGSATPVCAPTCSEGTSCQSSGGMPACQALRVELLSPDAGTYLGGETVAVVVTVKNADGTGWDGASVPLRTTPDQGSSSLTRMPSGRYEGAVALPATAGMLTLTAGWTGAEASVTVTTEACSQAQAASCAAWEACVPTASGGTCENTNPMLTWAAPDAGMRVPGGVALPLKVQVAVSPTTKGATVYPANVPVVRVGSNVNVQLTRAMSGPAGVYEGTIDPGMTEGDITLTAGWAGDAGPQKSVNVYVDVLPPQVGLLVETDGGQYYRDSLVLAALTTDEPLSDAGVTLAGVPAEPRPLTDCNIISGLRNVAGCYALDFSKPAMNALDGGFQAQLTATDMFGHTVSGADGGVLPVTRVRWTSNVGPGGEVTALAVAPDGGVYVGLTTGLREGTVQLLASATGALVSSWGRGAVQSLAANDDVVFYAMNEFDAGASIGGFGGTTRAPCVGVPSNMTYSGIALVRSSVGAVGAVGSINSASTTTPDGLGCIFYATRLAVGFIMDSSLLDSFVATSSATPSTSVNVIVANAASSAPTASFLNKPTTSGASWRPVSNLLSAPSSPMSMQVTNAAPLPPMGQALLPDASVLITTESIVAANVFVGNVSNVSARSGTLGAAVTAGVPVVASGTEAYAGSGLGLVRFDPAALGSSVPLLPTDAGTETFYLSPVLTRGQDGGVGSGYAIGSGGSLTVFGQGDGGVQWRAALGGAVATHPTFDCNRLRPQSKTGILYVGKRNGSVQAIIVDSPKLLDTPGAWPKYQRSMGNAGNDDLTNFPTNWPGCP